MDTARWTIVGAVSVSLVAVGIFWFTLPDGGPPTPPALKPPTSSQVQARSARATPAIPSPAPTPRGGGKAKAKGAARSKAKAQAKAEARERMAADGVPEDVIAMIEEVRADKVAKSEAKLQFYAERAQWSPETTEAVNTLVASAHAEVDQLLADATAGEVPWTDVKSEVRRIRMDQAVAVRDALGDEEFARFAKAMGRSRGRRGGRR